jgi:hypothetical protein
MYFKPNYNQLYTPFIQTTGMSPSVRPGPLQGTPEMIRPIRNAILRVHCQLMHFSEESDRRTNLQMSFADGAVMLLCRSMQCR